MRKRNRWALALASLGTAYAINTVFFPAIVVGTFLFVLCVHEFGHYFAAISIGNDAYPPVFIPLGFVTIGIVSAQTDKPHRDRFIAIAGPYAAVMCSAALTAFAIMCGWITLAYVGAFALACELWAITFGGDGRRHRHKKRTNG